MRCGVIFIARIRITNPEILPCIDPRQKGLLFSTVDRNQVTPKGLGLHLCFAPIAEIRKEIRTATVGKRFGRFVNGGYRLAIAQNGVSRCTQVEDKGFSRGRVIVGKNIDRDSFFGLSWIKKQRATRGFIVRSG